MNSITIEAQPKNITITFPYIKKIEATKFGGTFVISGVTQESAKIINSFITHGTRFNATSKVDHITSHYSGCFFRSIFPQYPYQCELRVNFID